MAAWDCLGLYLLRPPPLLAGVSEAVVAPTPLYLDTLCGASNQATLALGLMTPGVPLAATSQVRSRSVVTKGVTRLPPVS